MKTYIIDTNAIFDFCYRYYPKKYFSTLWELIETYVISRQIKLIITEHIYDEIQEKIVDFNYDKTIFEDFCQRFKLEVIPLNSYKQQLAELKKDIYEVSYKLTDKKLDEVEDDLSNTCVAQVLKGHTSVITSEQGLNKDIDKRNYGDRLKIPDTCRFSNVECGNWLNVFNYIGYKDN